MTKLVERHHLLEQEIVNISAMLCTSPKTSSFFAFVASQDTAASGGTRPPTGSRVLRSQSPAPGNGSSYEEFVSATALCRRTVPDQYEGRYVS